MINVDQIRSMIQRVVLSKISIDEFDEWVAMNSWDMHKDSCQEAQKLIGKVELALAEFDGDYLSEQDLQIRLSSLLPYFVIAPKPTSQVTSSASASPFIPLLWSVVADKLPAKGLSYTLLLPA